MTSCRRAASQARSLRLWKDFFRDPSQWLDCRNGKKHARAADFLHRTTYEPLWLDSSFNPSWVFDMLNFDHLKNPISHPVPPESKHWRSLSLDDALTALEQGLNPHPAVEDIACIVQKCRTERSQQHALRMHAYVHKWELDTHVSIGNSLVSMLAEVASVDLAQQVFDRLDHHDEAGWSSLIMGYSKCEEQHNALQVYEKMYASNACGYLNGHTFLELLKACAALNDWKRTFEIHAEIGRKGLLEKDAFVASTLIDTYGKCGFLAKAQEAFDKLLERDVVTWTALIAGYVQHGCAEMTVHFFQQMQQQGVTPDSATLVCVLKACGMLGDIKAGQKIARGVLETWPIQDLLFWNALIAGYAEQGHGEEALKCYEQMKQESFSPNDATYVCLLKACGLIGAVNIGRELHCDISKAGSEREIAIGSSLVDMYAKCGLLSDAQDAFDKLPTRGVVTWNALMAGYVETGCDGRVLDCFRGMEVDQVSPDAVSYIYCLKACCNTKDVNKGVEIHMDIAKEGLDRDLVVGSTLIDMYGKWGLLGKAREVFYKLPIWDVVSWNALIAGYVDNGQNEEALACFKKMQSKSTCPHAAAFVCTLKACANIKGVSEGQRLHVEIVRRGLETDLVVGSSVIDFYAKCGLLSEAQRVFDKLPAVDVVAWNALLLGYTSYGCDKKAIESFGLMRHKGIWPNDISYTCIVKAYGKSGDLDKSLELHADITREGWEKDLFIGSTLVDAYAKCGAPDEAQATFSLLPAQDVVAWTALIAGYGLQLGKADDVRHVLDRMVGMGIEPNVVTLASVLTAFGHAGQVDQAQVYFESISNAYGIIPSQEHFVCMVDLLGRTGHMREALAMINKMPLHPATVVWDSILGACRKWGDVELGRRVFEHAVSLDEKNTAAYVCMSNIFADAAVLGFKSHADSRRVAAAA